MHPYRNRPTAYALAFINKTAFPPVIERISIFSSSSITTDLRRHHIFCVLEADGSTLEVAENNLRSELHTNPAYRDWCPALLESRKGEAVAAENVHAAFVSPPYSIEPWELSAIRVLYRDGNGSMGLWGIPYDMRAEVNQNPKNIDPQYRGPWIWLGSPGWWGNWSVTAIGRIKAYLAKLHTPDNPHEWCKVAESKR